MAQKWLRLSELRRQKISNDLDSILESMVPSRHFAQPTYDLSSFTEQLVNRGLKDTNSTAGVLVRSLQKRVKGIDLIGAIRAPAMTFGQPGQQSTLSPGLAAVFDTAFAIRRRTGGKDDFIGVRHVIMAILTQPSAEVATELGLALAPVGMIPFDTIALDITEAVIIPFCEETESLAIWSSILAERGFERAVNLLSIAASDGLQRKTRRGPNTRQRKPPPFVPDAIAAVRNDDPHALGAGDIIGHDQAAFALARVVAAKTFRPPLAVGVFGSWGSGKSLFMRRVGAEVDRLAAMEIGAYHQNIPEVRFNAWHYVDGDLWASLVGHIFETLETWSDPPAPASGGGLLGRLTTARELSLASAKDLAAKRQAALQAQAELQKASENLRAKRKEFVTWLQGAGAAAVAGLKTAFSSEDAKALVDKTYGRTLEEMVAQWAGPQEAAKALRRDGAVLLEVKRSLIGRSQILWCIAIAAFLFVLPLLLSLAATSPPWLATIAGRMEPISLALMGLVTTAGGWLAALVRKAVTARDAVVKAAERYRAAVDTASAEASGDLAAKLRALDGARLEVEEAKQTLDEAISSQAEAAAEFARSSPAERLKAFVKARAAAEGPYRSRQGLVSTIRRDFADLVDLLSEAPADQGNHVKEADKVYASDVEHLESQFKGALTEAELRRLRETVVTPPKPPIIDRIVLYIDDLDRCPFEKVMEVLQAVHLIMAFPLFVVLVAVDVRWLERSLEETHIQFGDDFRKTSPIEYLEKIFQLAIWTEPLTLTDAAAFINARLPIQRVAAAAPPGPTVPRDVDTAAPIGAHLQAELDPSSADTVAAAHIPSLEVSREEADFLTAITAPFEMSPRRLLRFLNSYQVARVVIGAKSQVDLRALQALASVLVLAVARPDRMQELTKRLGHASGWSDFASVLRTSDDTALSDDISVWIGAAQAAGVNPKDILPWTELAMRFSFKQSRYPTS